MSLPTVSDVVAGPEARAPRAGPQVPPGRADSKLGAPTSTLVPMAWLVAILAFLLFSWVAIRQHDTFHTRARDMGIYAQVVWNTAHGRPFASTLLQDNRLHVAEHVAPVLLLLAPLYAAAPDPRLLLVLQQACLAAAGLPIFFWSRRHVGDLAALGLLVGYELMPATSRVAFSEFHPIVMAALPIALGVAATLDGRVRAAVVWLALALLVEEETAPIVGAAGAYLCLSSLRPSLPLPLAGPWGSGEAEGPHGRPEGDRGRGPRLRWSGFSLGALAVGWLLVVTLVVMPAFHEQRTLDRVGGNRTLDHFAPLREDPGIVVSWLTGDRGAHAAAWLLLPTLGLPLLAPQVLALAVPSFTILFVADRPESVAGHWAGAVLPVYWFAASAGLGTVMRLVGRRGGMARRRLVAGGFVGVLALVLVVCFVKYSYFPGGGENDTDWLAWTEQEENLASAVALVPDGARVDATRRIVPHLAHRPEVYQFPSTLYSAPTRPDLGKIDVFLFDLTDSQTARALDATDQDTVLTRRPRFNVWVWGESVLLLTRDRPTPPRPADATFGGALRLAGYDLSQRPGRVRLTAFWETAARVGAWTRTAELIGPDGRVVAQVVGAPLDPYLPPSKWDRGQSVVEAIDLRPPPDLPAGQYRLRLSWRDQAGAPVPTERGDGAEVATVTLP